MNNKFVSTHNQYKTLSRKTGNKKGKLLDRLINFQVILKSTWKKIFANKVTNERLLLFSH